MSLSLDIHPYVGMSKGKVIRYGGPRRDRHGMFIGPSGSGKDTSHLFVDLLTTNESMIVFDPAGEALAVTGRFRQKLGPVKVIDPMGVIAKFGFPHLNHFRSNGFDPVRQLHAKNPTLATDVARLSEVKHPYVARDPYWTNMPRQLDDCLTMYECFKAEAKGRKPSHDNVMTMMTLPHTHPDPQKDTLRDLMILIAGHNYAPMARLANSFIPSNKTIEGVISTAISNCRSLISDTQIIADMTLGGDTDWEQLKHKVGTYYIILPGNAFETHAVWLRLVLGDILSTLEKTPPGKQRPIIKLNEVENLGLVAALVRAIRMIRKNGVRIHTYWQSMGGIEDIYGQGGLRSFITNSGIKTAWATDDETTMRYYAMRGGTETVLMDSYHTNQEGDGKQRHAAGYNVLNPEDVSAIEDGTTLNFLHGFPYVQKLETPFYQDICRGYDPNPYH